MMRIPLHFPYSMDLDFYIRKYQKMKNYWKGRGKLDKKNWLVNFCTNRGCNKLFL